jgi:peptidoglycan/LPS O-acetylase OafA/YrhL
VQPRGDGMDVRVPAASAVDADKTESVGLDGRINHEIRALTGLRGLAAADVALMHINGSAQTFLTWFAFHNPAVDIFFCLSSFTLCLVYGAGTDRPFKFKEFAAARCARIYPLYAIVLVVWTVYCALWNQNLYSGYSWSGLIGDGVRQVLMINAWPIIGSGAHWIDPMWSLSVEAFGYVLVFPILFKLSGWTKSLPASALLAAAIFFGCATFGFFTLFYNPGINSHHIPPATGFLIRWVAPVRGSCMFAAGWTAYLLYLNHPTVRRALVKGADFVAIAMILIVAGQAAGIVSVELLVVLTPFLILGLVSTKSLTARILSAEPLHFLGLISYSLYLLHWPVMVFVRSYIPGLAHRDLLRVAVTVGIALVAAVLSYFFIERPSRRRLRQLLMPGSRGKASNRLSHASTRSPG